jgi:hypothetical protein
MSQNKDKKTKKNDSKNTVSKKEDSNEGNKLDKFTISEVIHYTGTRKFNQEDVLFWEGKNSSDFFSKYIDNPLNDVERNDNVLELYYNGDEFVGNSKRTYFEDDKNYGYIKLARANLYLKSNDSKIGIAQFLCTSNIFDGKGYVTCESTYFIESEIIPGVLQNINIGFKPEFSSINFRDNYIERTVDSTFWVPGDAFFPTGDYCFENGLSKTNANISIYLPYNSERKRRSICIHFDTLISNNFLPQKEYGSDRHSINRFEKVKDEIRDSKRRNGASGGRRRLIDIL